MVNDVTRFNALPMKRSDRSSWAPPNSGEPNVCDNMDEIYEWLATTI